MKILLTSLMILFSCGTPNNTVSEVPAMDEIPTEEEETITLISSANLEGRNTYMSSGSVKLFYDEETDEYIVSIENFSSDNGPDLHLYISDDSSASNFVDFGGLKSTSGDQTYRIAASQFNDQYTYVHIWCVLANEAFGETILE